MNDINRIIEMTTQKTGMPEALVEKIVRSMFNDVYDFANKKKGFNVQIPEVGTIVFRANAIPNYTDKTKRILAYWVSRLFIGEDKGLEKTIIASRNNIAGCMHNLEKASLIKEEYLDKHAKYKPKTKIYLEGHDESNNQRVLEYVSRIKTDLLTDENNSFSEKDMQ